PYLSTVGRRFPPRSCKSGDKFPAVASVRHNGHEGRAPDVTLCTHDGRRIDGDLAIEVPEQSLGPFSWRWGQFVKSVFCGIEEVAVGIEEHTMGVGSRWVCDRIEILQNGLGIPVDRRQFENHAGAKLGSTF